MNTYGMYRWFPKTLAFRADYCLNCDAERLALRIRTVDFFSIVMIPVLPLGVWRRWCCAVCGNPPHHKVSMWRAVRVMIALGFVVQAAVFWVQPAGAAEPPFSATLIWILRAVTLVLAGLMLWWALRPVGRPALRRQLAAVRPLDVTKCPVCGYHRLEQLRDEAFCRSCSARHLPLRNRGRSSPGPYPATARCWRGAVSTSTRSPRRGRCRGSIHPGSAP